MPIINYQEKAEKEKIKLFRRKDISLKNFEYLRDFMDAYEVSPARLSIFCRHIIFLLKNSQDIKKDMNDYKKINKIFRELRENLKDAYYATIINVSSRFVRWLNGGEKPKGFRDIKNKPKRSMKRDLEKEDMLEWEDGIKMASFTNSIQLKAIIMIQLDGGFRPSEFIDMNYGNITREGKFLVASVNGKTGKRQVILYKCAPYLNRWLQSHPTKDKDDPLWIMEYPSKSNKVINAKITRYDYFAILKIIKKIGKKAEVKKPLDFYNFRHSACRLAKLENLPTELAAEKFGHSVEYFVNTYGRLDTVDKINRHKKAYGEDIKENVENIDKPKLCLICDTINEPAVEICEKCGNPLTLSKALSIEKDKSEELKDLKFKIEKMNKILMALANERRNAEIIKVASN